LRFVGNYDWRFAIDDEDVTYRKPGDKKKES
jgi:hypothetical protein